MFEVKHVFQRAVMVAMRRRLHSINLSLASRWANFLQIVPLSPNSLPTTDFTHFGTGFLSSPLPGVRQNDKISP
jgi:hypothetical protein